jgi:hypothetical protein
VWRPTVWRRQAPRSIVSSPAPSASTSASPATPRCCSPSPSRPSWPSCWAARLGPGRTSGSVARFLPFASVDHALLSGDRGSSIAETELAAAVRANARAPSVHQRATARTPAAGRYELGACSSQSPGASGEQSREPSLPPAVFYASSDYPGGKSDGAATGCRARWAGGSDSYPGPFRARHSPGAHAHDGGR